MDMGVWQRVVPFFSQTTFKAPQLQFHFNRRGRLLD
jgi:hypothetical protein